MAAGEGALHTWSMRGLSIKRKSWIRLPSERIACARALVGRPDLVFADEPTGNLDSNASAEVLSFLRQSVDDFGQTIAMVTHDPRGAAYADRVVFLADGRVVADLASPSADTVLEQMKALSS